MHFHVFLRLSRRRPMVDLMSHALDDRNKPIKNNLWKLMENLAEKRI